MKIAVTGAFGYSGRYVTKRLLAAGHEVMALTNSLKRDHPFGDAVQAFPLAFSEPEKLESSLKGCDTLINTYWVRFDHRMFNHREAVENTKVLFQAAKSAGVGRILHVSITNPDANSKLSYFSGKAELEASLRSLGPSYCILRPTVLFGDEDILINNIAWAARRFPVFGVFGDGKYKLQPIYVDDMAEGIVDRVDTGANEVVNAIGPETFTYRELVERVMRTMGVRRPIVRMNPRLGYWVCRAAGAFVHDVIVTPEEIQGLMENRLLVDGPALGQTKLTEWLESHKDSVGRHYASELSRRTNRSAEYSAI